VLSVLKARYILVVIAAFVLGLGVSILVGLWVSGLIFRQAEVPEANLYAGVFEFNFKVKPITAMSSAGEITVPIPGKVNVVLPQYVHCPDICHWETSILKYVLERLVAEGIQDEVVFVTLGVNPYYETVEDGERYLEEMVGDFLAKGVTWIWVQDDLETMKELWMEYRFLVKPYCVKEDGTVEDLPVDLTPEDVERLLEECRFLGINHTGGFVIVDREGTYRYFIAPTDEGWTRGQRQVAETIYRKLLEVIREG
jgi:protein SCO1/2